MLFFCLILYHFSDAAEQVVKLKKTGDEPELPEKSYSLLRVFYIFYVSGGKKTNDLDPPTSTTPRSPLARTPSSSATFVRYEFFKSEAKSDEETAAESSSFG